MLKSLMCSITVLVQDNKKSEGCTFIIPWIPILDVLLCQTPKIAKFSKIVTICCSCSVCVLQSLQSFSRIFAATS